MDGQSQNFPVLHVKPVRKEKSSWDKNSGVNEEFKVKQRKCIYRVGQNWVAQFFFVKKGQKIDVMEMFI